MTHEQKPGQKPKLVLGQPPKRRSFEEWKAWMEGIYQKLTGKPGGELSDEEWQHYWEKYKEKRGWK